MSNVRQPVERYHRVFSRRKFIGGALGLAGLFLTAKGLDSFSNDNASPPGGAGGPSSFYQLNDVRRISQIKDGDVWAYDASNSQWLNKAPTSLTSFQHALLSAQHSDTEPGPAVFPGDLIVADTNLLWTRLSDRVVSLVQNDRPIWNGINWDTQAVNQVFAGQHSSQAVLAGGIVDSQPQARANLHKALEMGAGVNYSTTSGTDISTGYGQSLDMNGSLSYTTAAITEAEVYHPSTGSNITLSIYASIVGIPAAGSPPNIPGGDTPLRALTFTSPGPNYKIAAEGFGVFQLVLNARQFFYITLAAPSGGTAHADSIVLHAIEL